MRVLKVKVFVTQSCPTLCDPMDCSPPGSSVHGINSPGNNSGVDFHFLLQRIFPTSGHPHCRKLLYHLSHQEKVVKTRGWLLLLLSQESIPMTASCPCQGSV